MEANKQIKEVKENNKDKIDFKGLNKSINQKNKIQESNRVVFKDH